MKKNLLFLIAPFLCLAFANFGEAQCQVLAGEETNIVHLDDNINIPERSLEYQGEIKKAKAQVFDPNGASYSGHSFIASEIGVYTVTYSAYFGNVEIKENVKYLVERRSHDLFSFDSKRVTGDDGYFSYGTLSNNVSGAIFDVSSGATITCDSIFDATKWNANDPFIEFIIDPTTQGTPDFNSLKIFVTDVEDPSNYIEIQCDDSGSVDTNGNGMYVRAGFCGGTCWGRETFYKTSGITYSWHSSKYGEILDSNFKAYPVSKPVKTCGFILDNENMILYGNRRYGNEEKCLINQFNAEKHLANPWQGWTSGKVKISLSPVDFSTAKGRIIITSIGGVDLSDLVLPDVEAPVININYDGQSSIDLPKAKINQAYNVFQSEVIDNFDINLEADINVKYIDNVHNKKVDVSVNDGAFVPTKEGQYTITYNAIDKSGNEAEPIVLTVSSTNYISPLSLSLPQTAINSKIFNAVELFSTNEIIVSGGSGKVKFTRTILNPQGNEIEITNNSLYLDELGTYYVSFNAVDYIGNTASAVLTINSLELDGPIFLQNSEIPLVLIKGFTYQVPELIAVETYNGEVKYLNSTITANGDKVENNTFVAGGDNEVLVYTSLGSSSINTSKTITIPVVDTNNSIAHDKYFYGNANVTLNKDDVTLSAINDAYSLFANPLNTKEFEIFFALGDMSQVSEFDLTLTDTSDYSKTVTFRIKKLKDGFGVKLPFDIEKEFNTNSSGAQSICFDGISFDVYDASQTTIGKIKKFDNGEIFTGFSGSAYLSFSFVGVIGLAEVAVTKIDNQVLGHKNTYAKEKGKPIIVFDEEFITIQKVGNNLVYPTFTPFDVLSDIGNCTITINSVISGDNKCTETFLIEETGEFLYSYTARDKNGNTVRGSTYIYVFDVKAPTLTVKGNVPSTVDVNSSVELPSYTASDDSNYVVVDVILSLPNNESRLLTHDDNGTVTYNLIDTYIYGNNFIVDKTHFRAFMKGKYSLRYIAYDKEYNRTVKEFTFTAK